MTTIEMIIEHNYKALEKVDFDQNRAKNLFTIEHNGTIIYDFLHDESLRDEVIAFQYYGFEKMNNVIREWEKKR
jgi:hypothetical protein